LEGVTLLGAARVFIYTQKHNIAISGPSKDSKEKEIEGEQNMKIKEQRVVSGTKKRNSCLVVT